MPSQGMGALLEPVSEGTKEARREGPSGASTPEVDPAKLAEHNTQESAWVAISGQVYDVTSLISFHPGGGKLIIAVSGKDATNIFENSHVGPSLTAAAGLLKSMPFIGVYRP